MSDVDKKKSKKSKNYCMENQSSRDLLLLCSSKYEVDEMRRFARTEQNSGKLNGCMNHYFFGLSGDCLRYLFVLNKTGIHANNIEDVTFKSQVIEDFCKKGKHAFAQTKNNYRLSDSSLFDVAGTRTLKCKYCGQTMEESYVE